MIFYHIQLFPVFFYSWAFKACSHLYHKGKKNQTHTHFIDGNWTNQQYCNCNLIFSQQLRQHCHNSSLILGYRVGKLLGSYNKTMTDWEVNIIDSYWVTWVWMNRFLLDWRPEELNSCWDNNFAIFFYKIV